MIRSHILGFPRMGAQRELKFALEKYWRGEIDAAQLKNVARELRQWHWALQRDAGLDMVTVGDFALYDHMLNHIQMLGCEPKRFGFGETDSDLPRYFTMARGLVTSGDHGKCNHDHAAHSNETHALEMTKWFDTNYHYLVPEFEDTTIFRLSPHRLLSEVAEAQALGHTVKPVLIGPLTFLYLGKEKYSGKEKMVNADEANSFDRLQLLESLLPAYVELLSLLSSRGIEWVQIDEPILGCDLPPEWSHAFERAYRTLQLARVKLMLTTYFSPLENHLQMVCKLPVAGLHIDAVRADHELRMVLDWMPVDMVLSIGIIDGRNIWRSDIDRALEKLVGAQQRRRDELWIAPSCSLLHVPFSLADDGAIDSDVRGWLAGAIEKIGELALLKKAINDGKDSVQIELAMTRAVILNRRQSQRVHNPVVEQRIALLSDDVDKRKTVFAARQPLQRARFNLPAFPTTTIGSFPQTKEIRNARAAYKRKELSALDYQNAMRREIEYAVRKQETLDIDVLVHGEAERNDMVEYFGEQLDGFTFSANGWVQSYGSRCVKPPILFGDVSRPEPMTVAWTAYAQSLTTRPMKGMLTGPITILQWSFVRDDQPRNKTAMQIALAIRDEVVDLERAGIGIIQIDEPAIREGLPLRRAQWRDYLDWSARAFRIAASGVADSTQIHTHMCYAEFNDILPDIAAMDADVITIETSRSDMELLNGFGDFKYPNEIGPGVYDIHSPRVPTVKDMVRLLQKAATVVPAENLWVNPDCGLKTRAWEETEIALANMVEAARQLRQ